MKKDNFGVDRVASSYMLKILGKIESIGWLLGQEESMKVHSYAVRTAACCISGFCKDCVLEENTKLSNRTMTPQMKRCIFVVVFCCMSMRTKAGDPPPTVQCRLPSLHFNDIIRAEALKATQKYFIENPNPGSGEITRDMEAYELFEAQYGNETSSAGFTAALLDLDLKPFERYTFADCIQFILGGGYHEARIAFSADLQSKFSSILDDNGFICGEDEERVGTTASNGFSSIAKLITKERYVLFLNLRVGSRLSIVIDTTGSMGTEINAVKSAVFKVIDSTTGTIDEPLEYVLMPYNDPGTGPLTKTRNPGTMKMAVNRLSNGGGGDFPEKAMIGLIVAGHNSGYGSHLFLFTDATEKFINLRSHALAILMMKKIRVSFLITPGQSDQTNVFKSYDPFARLTGGEVIRYHESEIAHSHKMITSMTVQGMVLLKSLTESGNAGLSVKTDESVKNLLVQFSTKENGSPKPGVDLVSGPEPASVLEDLKQNSLLYAAKGISTSQYNIDLSRSTSYSLKVWGKSTLGFYGKLKQEKNGMFATPEQLQTGVPTKAEFTVFGDSNTVKFNKFQVVSRQGNVLIEKDLKGGPTNYFATESILLPNEPTRMKLVGVNINGEEVERIDPCVVQPYALSSYIDDIEDTVVEIGKIKTLKINFNNVNEVGRFYIGQSDSEGFVTPYGYDVFQTSPNNTIEINVPIKVPGYAKHGIVSRVLVSVGGPSSHYVVTYKSFNVRIVDGKPRCPNPSNPIGGIYTCDAADSELGDKCRLSCIGSYTLKGSAEINCTGNGTWDTESTCVAEPGTFQLYGGSHYKTLDGVNFNLNGNCLHKMIETKPGLGLPSITILARNGGLYQFDEASFFEQAVVIIEETEIMFLRQKVILVNGLRQNLPISISGKIEIRLDASYILLSTSFGLNIRYDGWHDFTVSLPAMFRDGVTGLAGNFNYNKTDELTVGNTIFANWTAFAENFIVADQSDVGCLSAINDEDSCTNSELNRKQFETQCIFLKTCFAQCGTAEDRTIALGNCVLDMCKTNGSKQVLEDTFSILSEICSLNGENFCDWRTELNMPKFCPPNSKYQANSARCHNTCFDTEAVDNCEGSLIGEACVCKPGYVRSGRDCIPTAECGCIDSNGYYRKADDEWYADTKCSEYCKCSNGITECSFLPCNGTGKACTAVIPGVYSCIEEQPAGCSLTGGSNYKTFDGYNYRFKSDCRYVMYFNGDVMISVQLETSQFEGLTSIKTVYIEIGHDEIAFYSDMHIAIKIDDNIVQGQFLEKYDMEEGRFWIQQIGSILKFVDTKGVTVDFDGTNFFIQVDEIFKNNQMATGLCGSYSDDIDDDLLGKTIDAFASYNVYHRMCDKRTENVFECPVANRTKWESLNQCGMITDKQGPFASCHASVASNWYFENCVDSMCASEGDMTVLFAAISAYERACLDMKVNEVCDWTKKTNLEPECPSNSYYDGCASICTDTCQDDYAVLNCNYPQKLGRCICDYGFLMSNGECVPNAECGCTVENQYVKIGETHMGVNCTHTDTCMSTHTTLRKHYPTNACSDTDMCVEENGLYSCEPNPACEEVDILER